MVAFTQGLLQSTDPKTLRGFFDPSDSDAESSRAASPTPDDDAGSRMRASSPVRALSFTSLQSLAEAEHEASPDDGVFHASPEQFSLRVGGRLHVFELSLCGTEVFGHDPVRVHASSAARQEESGLTRHRENPEKRRGDVLGEPGHVQPVHGA